MKHLLVLIVVFSSSITIRAQEPEAADGQARSAADVPVTGKPDAELAKHQGVWKPIAAVLGGARIPTDAVKTITLKISGQNYEVTVEGEDHADKGTFTLDTTTTPKRITIKSTTGPNKGKTFLAIYEMKDSVSMRICYDLSGKAFPTELKAPKDTPLYLAGYRRQAKSDSANGKQNHIILNVDGTDVRVPVDEQVYLKWQKQFAGPGSTPEQKQRLATVMDVLRAAYQQGRKDAHQRQARQDPAPAGPRPRTIDLPIRLPRDACHRRRRFGRA
jgi:uncharacterized protein (TIGR03067 family)